MKSTGEGTNVVSMTGSHVAGDLGGAKKGLAISRLRELLRPALTDRLKHVLDQVDDAFFDLADKAENNQQQMVYFDAMRELRLKSKVIEGDFVAWVMKDFEHYLNPAILRRRADKDSSQENELSLVETDELELDLAIQGMAGKARRAHEDVLYLLGLRMAALAGRPAQQNEDDFPVSPERLSEAFGEATKTLEMPIRPKLVLFKLFDNYFISELGSLYEAMNDRLIESGLLPDLKLERKEESRKTRTRTRKAAATTYADQESEEDERSDDALAAALRAFLHSTPQPASSGGSALELKTTPVVDGSELLGALNRLQHTLAITTQGTLEAGTLKQKVLEAASHEGAQSPELRQVDEKIIDIVAMLFDFLLSNSTLPDVFKGLIGRLQLPVLKVAIIDATFFTRRHHPARRLINMMAHAGSIWRPVADGEPDELLAETQRAVSRIIDEFENDPDVFARVVEDYEYFLESEQNQAIEREASDAERILQRERRESGKRVATRALERIIADQPVPEEARHFLETRWRNLLIAIYLAGGVDSSAWNKALNIASTLVWSLLPKETDELRSQLTGSLPPLLRALREGMDKLKMSEEEQQEFLNWLAAEHSRLAKSKSTVQPQAPEDEQTTPQASGALVEGEVASAQESIESTIEPEDAPEAIEKSEILASDRKSFMARKAEEINRMIAEGRFLGEASITVDELPTEEAIDDEFTQQAQTIAEGTWLEWLAHDDDSPQRIKLSWRSTISGKCFFVDRRGFKAAEMMPSAFARELREGRLRLIDDSPAVDHALQSALSALSQTPADGT